MLFSGCGFLIVFAFGCYLWYQHELEPYKQEAAEAHRQWEASQKADANSDVEQVVSDALVERSMPTVAKPITETVEKNVVFSDLHENLTEQMQETVTTEDVRVSPHGFGPYPKTPEGWSPIPWELYKDPDRELMTRVRIKILEQGKPIKGVTMDRGKVYPIISGIRYIKWETEITQEGEVKQRITRSLGTIEDGRHLAAIREAKGGHFDCV